MTNKPVTPSPLAARLLSRRRLLAAAGGAAAAAFVACRITPAQAVLKLDVTQGTPQPIPIAIPDFVAGGAPEEGGPGREVNPGHHQQSSPLGPVSAARSRLLHRAHPDDRRQPALSGLARDQRAGAGDRPHRPRAGRPLQGRIPAVGRIRRKLSQRPAVFRPARQHAADRAYHFRRRFTSASPARKAISIRASSSSTRRGRKTAASSASPSWIRTAPMCATSRAAKIWC